MTQCSSPVPNRRALMAVMIVLALSSAGVLLATGADADASDRPNDAGPEATVTPTASPPPVIATAIVIERGDDETTR